MSTEKTTELSVHHFERQDGRSISIMAVDLIEATGLVCELADFLLQANRAVASQMAGSDQSFDNMIGGEL